MTTNPWLATFPSEEEIHDEQVQQALEERNARIAALKAALGEMRNERDEARRGLMATRLQLEEARADFNTLAEEHDELTKLAQQAMRSVAPEERLMAASVLCARLVRPQRRVDAEDAVIERSEREAM